MSELKNAVEQVRERIARYSKTKASINEQNTKATLIQPILRALGWDVEWRTRQPLSLRVHHGHILQRTDFKNKRLKRL
jgi:hypothetical protein